MTNKSRKKKTKKQEKPKVNQELEGFDIEIDTFGEIKTNFDIDKINEFLNRTVDDKKLRGRKNAPGSARKKGDQSSGDSNKS